MLPTAKHRCELYARTFKEFDAVIGAFPGWYFENYVTPEYAQAFGGFPMFPDDEGYLTWHAPLVGGEGKVQTVSIEDDFGEMVHGMFLNPLKWKNKTIQCVSDAFTYEDMVKTFTEGKFPIRLIQGVANWCRSHGEESSLRSHGLGG